MIFIMSASHRSHILNMHLVCLQAALKLEEPITNFFDNVFVMADDTAIKNNRLALLSELASITKGIIDLTALPGF